MEALESARQRRAKRAELEEALRSVPEDMREAVLIEALVQALDVPGPPPSAPPPEWGSRGGVVHPESDKELLARSSVDTRSLVELIRNWRADAYWFRQGVFSKENELAAVQLELRIEQLSACIRGDICRLPEGADLERRAAPSGSGA